MKMPTGATARFSKAVEAAGKPEVISLWRKPERDKLFMAAVRQNRVMTVKQETIGSAKDFGIVGFLREKNVSYLIFPQSLIAFRDRRIVGINYDLIETPGPVGRVMKPETTSGKNRKGQRTMWQRESKRPSKLTHVQDLRKEFKVTIRFAATAEIYESVKAASRKEARELALRQAILPDLRRGTVTRKVVKIIER